MPPAGTRRPDAAQMMAMTGYIERAFERADASAKPDPGRMTAHRLNRTEYTNTIRDLLGVHFRAEKDFPADDSSDGFDNIGDVLTVSPLLMERYLSAAERIARWAISTEIPAKPLEVGYLDRESRIRRLDRSTIEAEHRVEFPGEYIVRFGLPGERLPIDGFEAAPVTLGFWMDGKLLSTQTAETKPSGLVYFNPYSEEEVRLYLPEGDHVFRAGFIDDGFVRMLPQTEAYSRRVNKFLDVDRVYRAVSLDSREGEPEKDPDLQPGVRPRVRRRDRHQPGAARIPSSSHAPRDRFADRLRRSCDGRRSIRGAGDTARHPGACWCRPISSSASSVIPTRAIRRSCTRCRRSSSHRASAISSGARCPMTRCWRSPSLASCAKPAVLEAQVDRMLADPRAAGFAANFAGQWLETRNLDSVKPDPDKFKEWNPELREAMKTETTMFFEHVLRENRPVSDFLNANYTFLNERLATHYGIDGVTGSEFRRVPLTTDRRGGVLSQAGVLTVSSYPTRTSPVIRGKYVLQNLLGIPPRTAAGRCAGARGVRRGRGTVHARTARCAPPQPDVRSVPSEHGSAGIRPGELRRHWPLARYGRPAPGGRERDAARWTAVHHRRRDARASRFAIAAVFAHVDAEDADVRSTARPEAVRSPHGRQHSPRRRGRRLSLPNHGSPDRQKLAISSPQGRRCRTEGYADVHHTPHTSTKNVPARHGDGRRSAFPRCDDARACQAAGRQGARAHGVRVRPERDGHAALEHGLRGQARRASPDPAAPRAAQERHPRARQPHP